MCRKKVNPPLLKKTLHRIFPSIFFASMTEAKISSPVYRVPQNECESLETSPNVQCPLLSARRFFTAASLFFVAKIMPLSQYFLSGRYFPSVSLRIPKNCSNTGEVKHSTHNPFFPPLYLSRGNRVHLSSIPPLPPPPQKEWAGGIQLMLFRGYF